MNNENHPAFDAETKKRVKIKEIFASIQGEGPYVGYKQLFIRFCNCNLKCNYCDTEFSDKNDYKEFSAVELAQEVNKYADVHSISLTGGEPLLSVEFLKEFLPKIKFSHSEAEKDMKSFASLRMTRAEESHKKIKKIYLETNATLSDKFLEIKPYIDIVSADIKLESATELKDTFKFHDKFFEACKGVETFAKIVFNNKITDEEIEQCCKLGQKYGIELILQPEMVDAAKQLNAARQINAARQLCSYAAKFSEDQRSGGQEGRLVNESSLSEISHEQQPDTVLSPYRPIALSPYSRKYLNLSTLQPFNPSTENSLPSYPHTLHPSIMSVSSDFSAKILDKFLQNYPNVRLIPQIHKFLNVR